MSSGISNNASPITLLNNFALFRFPWPSEVNLEWSALRESNVLAGKDPLLAKGSTNLELGIVHHKQLCRPKGEVHM